MDCVVLAGGKGTRLRPLTLGTPKPMVRLLEKPILNYTFDKIESISVEKTIVTLGYKAEMIENYLVQHPPQKTKVFFHREKTPLGTAGAVKFVEGNLSDTFLVLSGDAYFEFDLQQAINRHFATKADVTILVKEVDDAREYGLVQADSTGKITGFREKPGYTGAVSAFGNTGIYIVNKSVLQFIPKNKPFDFAKDLFPLLLQQNKHLQMSVHSEYWCDIGDIPTYLSCQRYLLQKTKTPHYKGEQATVAPNTKLKGNCVLEQGVEIGENCVIENSVLLKGAKVEDNCKLINCVIGENSVIKENVKVQYNCAVGENVLLHKNVKLKPNIRIYANRTVSEGIFVTESVQTGDLEGYNFTEQGLTGKAGTEITPVTAMKLGLAIGGAHKINRVFVSTDETQTAQVLSGSLLSGLGASAVKTCVIHNSFWGEFIHNLRQGSFQLGVFIKAAGQSVSFHITDGKGLNIYRELEREIEQNLNREQFSYALPANYITPKPFAPKEKYFATLEQFCGQLQNFLIEFQCENKNLEIKLNNLTQYKGSGKKMVTVLLDKDGCLLKVKDERGREFSKTQLYLLGALEELENKKDVVCGSSFPKVIDTLAKNYRGKVYRYRLSPLKGEDMKARQLLQKSPWATDDILLAFKVLLFANKQDITVEKLMEKVPAFCVLQSVMPTHVSPGKILQRVCNEFTQEKDGILVTQNGVNALLQVKKDGKGVNLYLDGPTLEDINTVNTYLQRRIKTVELDTIAKKNYN